MSQAAAEAGLDELASNGGDPEARCVRLVIPARAEYIALCRLALTGLARARPLSQELVEDLKLALTEAATNSVRHAYADGNGVVEILYELHPDVLVIEVADDGAGFDPGSRDGAEGLAEGGLGIEIIRAIADEVEIARRDGGRGSKLRFIKRLT